MLPISVKFLGFINAVICVHCMCVYEIHVRITVAEEDTATATQAAVGRPKAAAALRSSAVPANLFEKLFSSLRLVNCSYTILI